MKIHSNVLLNPLDASNLNPWGRIDHVKRHSRSHYGLHVLHLNLEILERSAYLIVIASYFLVGDIPASRFVNFQQVQAERLVIGQLTLAVVWLQLFLDLRGKTLAALDF